MAAELSIPSHHRMTWPLLSVMRRMPVPLSNKEAAVLVAAELQLSDAQITLTRSPRGARTLLDYRLAWARTLLRGMGAVENVAPAVWQVTEVGRRITENEVADVSDAMLRKFVESKKR